MLNLLYFFLNLTFLAANSELITHFENLRLQMEKAKDLAFSCLGSEVHKEEILSIHIKSLGKFQRT